MYDTNDFSRSDTFNIPKSPFNSVIFDNDDSFTCTTDTENYFTGVLRSTQPSTPPAIDPHKPLFGAHPLLLSYSFGSESSSQYLDSSFSEQPAPNKHAGPTLSTPMPKTNLDLNPDSFAWEVLSDGKLAVQCKNYRMFISTGAFSWNMGPLKRHVGRKKCKQWQSTGVVVQREMRDAQNSRNQLFHLVASEKENGSIAVSPLSKSNFEVNTPSKFCTEESEYATDMYLLHHYI